MEAKHPVVVHLVHGTWPYGLLSQLGFKKKGELAWFEPESQVRKAIEQAAETPVDIREFRWSGRNCCLARGKAARDFREHLEAALLERGDTRHVVVAHSHGGTIAADALSTVRIDNSGKSRVKALVCMATPFAYVQDADDGAIQAYFIVGMMLAAVMIHFLLKWVGPGNYTQYWSYAVFYALCILMGMLMGAFSPHVLPSDYWYGGRSINRKIHVFLLRTPRDEAALLLGGSQMIQWIMGCCWSIAHSFLRWRYALGAIFIGMHVGLRLIPDGDNFLDKLNQIYIARYGNQPHSSMNAWFVVIVAVPFLLGVYLFFSRAIMNMAVGLPLRYWIRYRVAVDAAPPETPCTFKAYSRLGRNTAGLRCGIYELRDVQEEIGRLAGRVARGKAPRLLSFYELESEKEAADSAVAKKLQFFNERDLCWMEGPQSSPNVIILQEGQPDEVRINIGSAIRNTRQEKPARPGKFDDDGAPPTGHSS